MKKLFLVALATAVAFSMVGCKGTNEKRGDEHLKEGRFRNAINSYIEAKKKGNVSDEFFDNFSLALVRAAEVEAKKDINSELLSGYFDKVSDNLSQIKSQEVFQEVATIMANVGKAQVSQEGVDFGTIIGGFSKIDTAIAIAKRNSVPPASIQAIRTEAENNYIARNLGEAVDESDPVVSEYMLLRIAAMAPNNDKVKEALNKSRKGTRGYFLIFGENISDRSGSHLVDKWGYVMAFPTLKMTPTSLAGELQFWASTGNNTELNPDGIKLFSTTGEEVIAKAGSGWCEAEVLVGKKGDEKIEKKKQAIKKGTKGKLMNEFQCSLNVTFNFSKGFVPDYVEYKDEFGVGRKYLGQ